MSTNCSFSTCAHSSTVYTYQNKLLLRQSLYLGLPVGLMKHLCAGTIIACRRHSSNVYTYQNKLPLRQSLYLGLPVGLTKHLCAGTIIACRRMCKGDDLEDGLLMPNLS
jgi:hypothetical protein